MNPTDIIHNLNLETTPNRPLNNPFRYTPSAEVEAAQREVVEYLGVLSKRDRDVANELEAGKMMGILIVRNELGEMGYLAGFSGCMAGRLELDGFVPPIFGRDAPNEEFANRDRQIGALGRAIAQMEQSPKHLSAIESHRSLTAHADEERTKMSAAYAEAKRKRDEERRLATRPVAELQLESQRQKGEMKRRERALREQIEMSQQRIDTMQNEIEALRKERRDMSYELQRDMFESYKLTNGLGESRSLRSIFDEAIGRLPPSGAGECAAPKMLHYALTHNLTPIFIGEFWYGGSPRGEIRHHKHFYGACKSRCEPILCYMLQGVDVEPLTLTDEPSLRDRLRIVFEDQHIAIFDKPSGMLSVPGRSSAESVASIARELYPDATGPLIVHRLDQDTSGLIIIAKSAEVNKALQRQFMERSLQKRYVAIVEGIIESNKGEITLPLMPNIDDRPRHMVNHQHGKASRTTYEVLERYERSTRLALTPHTGRTHQLRIHCADMEGLSSPIIGDRLYGETGERLLLHAEQITFRHPVSGDMLKFSAPPQF